MEYSVHLKMRDNSREIPIKEGNRGDVSTSCRKAGQGHTSYQKMGSPLCPCFPSFS